jgi:hypothetical protein
MTWPVIQAASSVTSQAIRRAGSSGVVPRGEGLGQHDRGAGVDGPVRVEHRGGQRAQRAVAAAAGVVADQDVQESGSCGGRLDEPGRRIGV